MYVFNMLYTLYILSEKKTVIGNFFYIKDILLL